MRKKVGKPLYFELAFGNDHKRPQKIEAHAHDNLSPVAWEQQEDFAKKSAINFTTEDPQRTKFILS